MCYDKIKCYHGICTTDSLHQALLTCTTLTKSCYVSSGIMQQRKNVKNGSLF